MFRITERFTATTDHGTTYDVIGIQEEYSYTRSNGSKVVQFGKTQYQTGSEPLTQLDENTFEFVTSRTKLTRSH